MTLSVGIGARQPECVSDEWRWSYVLIFNETSTKGQAHSKPPAWLAIDPPSALLQRCSLTTASTTAAVRESESSWLWNPQMWGWHWFCSADLSCCFFFFFLQGEKKRKKKEHCRESSTLSALWAAEREMEKEDDSVVVGGLRPGETLVQQMGRFSALSLSIMLQAARWVTNTYYSIWHDQQ